MLELQKYLLSGKTLSELTAEFGIKITQHPTLPLAIYNYDQIESRPKTHRLIRECRGLILNSQTHDLVARSFPRFFNWGEVRDEMEHFDFSNFCVQDKEDGSLVILYYYDGQWRANTRGSFAIDKFSGLNMTWTEGICKALGIASLNEIPSTVDTKLTYIFEFCSPWNKVVRRYPQPVMFLITAFEGEREISFQEVDNLKSPLWTHVGRHDFRSLSDIQTYLRDRESADPTYEGVVIRDSANRRWKLKNPSYLALHALKGESDSLFHPKYLLQFILSGEDDELLTYFGEVSEEYYKLKSKVLEMYIELLEFWADHKDIECQKEFATKAAKQRFSGLLFAARRDYAHSQKSHHISLAWRNAKSLILKHLKNQGGKS